MADDDSTATTPEATEVIDSPVVTDETTATEDQTTAEPSDSSQDGTEETPAAPEADEKLRKYAANQGIELDSPGAIKAAQLAMKNQADKTRSYQKSSELEKAATAISDDDAAATAQATGQDAEILKRLQGMEIKESVRDFWNTPDADGNTPDKGMEQKMIELLQTKPYLAGDLESLYATAVLKSGGVASVKSQGKREALTNLAQKQQAAVPTGSATTAGTPKKKDFASLSIPEMEKQLGFAKT